MQNLATVHAQQQLFGPDHWTRATFVPGIQFTLKLQHTITSYKRFITANGYSKNLLAEPSLL